jgi:hypothetical protein
VSVPVIFSGAGSAKNMRYDMETQDIPFPSELPQGRQAAFDVKHRIVAKAQALMFNRLGQKGQKGSWGRMKNKLYYLQKPRLSTRSCDWMGHPGKCEAYLQGVLIHNVIVWACVNAGWQRDLKCKFLSLNPVFIRLLVSDFVFVVCVLVASGQLGQAGSASDLGRGLESSCSRCSGFRRDEVSQRSSSLDCGRTGGQTG